ncbi:unnamed protein product [Sphagnum troendelagicum]|uniref:Uncharacterized protein n=1 Tax=Sphagnum troendelagicum TaxID=128251 RepID=A0ABP0ULV7_9BRYO
MCFCGDLFAFELWLAERYFVENERQEGSMPADLLCGRDGVVIVRGFVASLVYCWSASEISKGCCKVSGFQDVESESSV